MLGGGGPRSQYGLVWKEVGIVRGGQVRRGSVTYGIYICTYKIPHCYPILGQPTWLSRPLIIPEVSGSSPTYAGTPSINTWLAPIIHRMNQDNQLLVLSTPFPAPETAHWRCYVLRIMQYCMRVQVSTNIEYSYMLIYRSNRYDLQSSTIREMSDFVSNDPNLVFSKLEKMAYREKEQFCVLSLLIVCCRIV